MRTSRARHLLAALFLAAAGAVVSGPAGAVEDGLMGARIGASYREVLRKFRQPNGMLIAAGGGIAYQAMPSVGSAGLPQFGQAGGGTGGTFPCGPSRSGSPSSPTSRRSGLYDMRKTRGVVLGIVFSGEGADAIVTDVIVAAYPSV